MPPPSSLREIDLSPKPGMTYASFTREWREEFIYFLLVDRFHDGSARTALNTPGRSRGVPAGDDFYGGTLKGVTDHLDYIAGLGCTALWLSPVFENNPGAYHGYNINNYLGVDPHFGTQQDLVDLVAAAHQRDPPMRIILDVVINHSGDNWGYPGDAPCAYDNDRQYPFGFWRRPDRPLPLELRDESLYHRRGSIHSADGWDAYPELQHGDVVSLKDFANDDDEAGSRLINALIKAHCYWIREADVDGFRVDAVKHMGELACSRFCSNIREYAYALGKNGFFLFGEVASSNDALLDRYIGQNTSRQDGEKTVFFGLDSVLDFRLAGSLPWVLKGLSDPRPLFERHDAQQYRALNRGEIGRFLVTFLDNHDSFWQPGGRFGAGATQEQCIAGVGYLLCALGTPCLYYGTEQGFQGQGGDANLREAMFDRSTGGGNLLNPECTIYKEIAKIAAAVRSHPALRFGRMYFREISGDGVHFGLPYGTAGTIAFSRILYPHEILVAYNVSERERTDCILVDRNLHQDSTRKRFLYGGSGTVPVEEGPGGEHFVRLTLTPHQFVILS